MGKGVAGFWQVGIQSNGRYLAALAHVEQKGKAVRTLDDLSRSRVKDGKRYARFNPVTAQDCTLFAAVMSGENAINAFRNRGLRAYLYHRPDHPDSKQHCARVSRLIAKLRGHDSPLFSQGGGLLAKVPSARLCRVTPMGYRVMSAALIFRVADFLQAFLQVA